MTEIELVENVGVSLINASASDNMVAMAAWVSHDADSEDRLQDEARVGKLIDFLYRAKHMSPFEHGHFTFKVDAPLFVAREFFRHRTASYNEVSGRYTEMKPRFYVANVARVQHGKPGDYYFEDGSDEQTAIYLQTKRKDAKRAWRTYQQRLEAGIAKEQAREELPLSLMTQFYVTMNPRNLMQFLTLRNEKHALKEIQDVAVAMEEIFATHMPLTYKAYIKGREAEGENVNDLKNRIGGLEMLVRSRNNKVEEVLGQNKLDAERITELEVALAEMHAKYNREFVATQEAMASAKASNAQHAVTSNYFNDIDLAKLSEKIAPVYNVYVDAKHGDTSIEELPGKIFEALKKVQRRL